MEKKESIIVPKWLYHKKHEAKIFHSIEDVKEALSEGWVECRASLKGVKVETTAAQKTQPAEDKKSDAKAQK